MSETSDDTIEIRVPCKPEYVRTIRRTIADFAESSGLSRVAAEDVELAAAEAVANIVRHAYEGLARDVPPVRVICSHHDSSLTVEVIDKGRGFAAPAAGVVPEIDMNRDGGMGIILIKLLMDSVKYVSRPSGGTRIRMTKTARQAVRTAARVRAARIRRTPNASPASVESQSPARRKPAAD